MEERFSLTPDGYLRIEQVKTADSAFYWKVSKTKNALSCEKILEFFNPLNLYQLGKKIEHTAVILFSKTFLSCNFGQQFLSRYVERQTL